MFPVEGGLPCRWYVRAFPPGQEQPMHLNDDVSASAFHARDAGLSDLLAILQAPHEVLGALAVLGCSSPASASHGPGCVPRLVAACRDRLLDASNGGAAPVTAAWALAVMQVHLVCW
jgi:hypothetical protein